MHRNINSLTVECRFAYDGGVEGRRGEVDEYVMVEVLGEEIAVDVWTKEYDNKGQVRASRSKRIYATCISETRAII